MNPDKRNAWLRKLDEECRYQVVLPRQQLSDDNAIMNFLMWYVGKFDMYVEDDYAAFVRYCFEDPLVINTPLRREYLHCSQRSHRPMPNTTAPKSKNVTQSANELMDTAGDTFKEIDKTIRKHLDERPYVVLGVVFAVGWLYAKIR